MQNRVTGTARRFAACREISEEVVQAISDLYPDDFERVYDQPSRREWSCMMNRAWDLADPDDNVIYWAGSHHR